MGSCKRRHQCRTASPPLQSSDIRRRGGCGKLDSELRIDKSFFLFKPSAQQRGQVRKSSDRRGWGLRSSVVPKSSVQRRDSQRTNGDRSYTQFVLFDFHRNDTLNRHQFVLPFLTGVKTYWNEMFHLSLSAR